MKKDTLHFLEFPRTNKLYSLMAKDSIDILMNIEFLFKNKLNLDKAYHEPDSFFIECNNIIRNIVFIIEKSKKSSTKYPWLYKFINEFTKKYEDEYCILVKIRDNSMHQELLITDGAIEFGLYKIMSKTSYKLKIGMGDKNNYRLLPSHYIYKETESFFQDLLILHYYLFTDLDHSAIGECLGISRWWWYKISYKDRSRHRKDKVIDVYSIISKITDALINGISNAYSQHLRIPFDKLHIHTPEKYNFINTLLEIDLYPNIFKEKWQCDVKPSNWKYLLEYNIIRQTEKRYKLINNIYSFIPKTKNELIRLLDRYTHIKIADFIDQEDYNRFVSFILLPHYYLENIKSIAFINKFDFSLIMELHKLGQEYILKVDLHFEEVDEELKDRYLEKIGKIINKIKTSIEKLC